MALLVTLTALTALLYALERNKPTHPHSPLSGSTHIHDRDTDRLTHDLLAHP